MQQPATTVALGVWFALAAAVLGASPEEPDRAPRGDSELLLYRSPDGVQRPVKTANEWAARRKEIRKGMQLVMGELPHASKLPPPTVKILGHVEGDRFVRLSISYLSEGDDDQVPAYLFLPTGRRGRQRLPAMLALHQTTPLGKKEVAGEGGSANLAYAKELAQRGYVVLAPDYPSFGDYPCDFSKSLYASGTAKGIANHMRGVDLLQARKEVDPNRIGVIGHSLGGHNAMFLGAFDERIKVIVSSCGWTPFHDYQGGNLAGWTSDRYMPRIREVYGLDPNRMPFDFYEVVAMFAPRAFFSNSPVGDDNFNVNGVKKAEVKVREVYAFLGATNQLQVRYPECGHDFPPDIRREAYDFIDLALKRGR